MAARTVPTPPTWTAGQRVTAAQLQLQTTWSNFWSSPPMFCMHQVTIQSVANTTYTQITMDTVDWDTDSGRAAGTPYSYTIPVGMTGRWTFTFKVGWAANATSNRLGALYKNGTIVQNGEVGYFTTDASNNPEYGTTVTVPCNAGDVMSVWAYQGSGGALNTKTLDSYFEGRLISLASP